jgi:hypothetical protein
MLFQRQALLLSQSRVNLLDFYSFLILSLAGLQVGLPPLQLLQVNAPPRWLFDMHFTIPGEVCQQQYNKKKTMTFVQADEANDMVHQHLGAITWMTLEIVSVPDIV